MVSFLSTRFMFTSNSHLEEVQGVERFVLAIVSLTLRHVFYPIATVMSRLDDFSTVMSRLDDFSTVISRLYIEWNKHILRVCFVSHSPYIR